VLTTAATDRTEGEPSSLDLIASPSTLPPDDSSGGRAPTSKAPAANRPPVGWELAGLASPISPSLASSWIQAQRLVTAAAPVSLAVDGDVSAASGGAGEEHGNSSGGNHEPSPVPGPAPGGAAGGAGGGGSGVGMSAFLTLAALLMLAGLHNTRRLRLSCRPLRSSFFALIPERPD
jgi:hypothetical protein